MTVVAVFLGAGYGAPCGMPVTRELFDATFEVDLPTRAALVERVIARYARWRERRSGGTAEEYLGDVEGSLEWNEALACMSLRLVLGHGSVGFAGLRRAIQRHQLTRADRCPAHVHFWDAFWRTASTRFEVSVVTTNYDVSPEQGLRLHPRPRVHRPGFHYGGLPRSRLAGAGFPIHRSDDLTPSGDVPLYKLHGSISWQVDGDRVTCFADCRPGIAGRAAIVAPGRGKQTPAWASPIWAGARDALSRARLWIVVGYSFPDYDEDVHGLLRDTAATGPTIAVISPESGMLVKRIAPLFPHARLRAMPRLPEAVPELAQVLRAVDGNRESA